MKINQEKCSVDKRSLIFDCDIDGHNYHFEYDDWNCEGIIKGGVVIACSKHYLQAYILTQNEPVIFIDRSYKHNYSYEVYYDGVVYTVEEKTNMKTIKEISDTTKREEIGLSDCCHFMATKHRGNKDFYCEWCCEKCNNEAYLTENKN